MVYSSYDNSAINLKSIVKNLGVKQFNWKFSSSEATEGPALNLSSSSYCTVDSWD